MPAPAVICSIRLQVACHRDSYQPFEAGQNPDRCARVSSSSLPDQEPQRAAFLR